MGKKKRKNPNPNCPVPGCQTKQPHAQDPIVQALILEFAPPEKMTYWVLGAMAELRNSIVRDLKGGQVFAWYTRFRQAEELYIRTLYCLFVANEKELHHVLSGEQPNGISALYEKVNPVIFEGARSQPFNNQPPPGATSFERGPFSVAVAPDPSGNFGKFAYVANYRSNKIAMYAINAATGALTSIGTVDAGLSPSSIAIDPAGRFAYVTNAGRKDQASNVSMYTINATTGALTSIGTVVAGLDPRSVAVDPSRRFAYVANLGDFVGEGCSLSMYTINATSGILIPTGTIDGCFPVSVAVDPSGKFACVASEGDAYGPDCCGSVGIYTIDAATGALTSIGTIPAGSLSSSIAVDPSGKYAYVANEGGGPEPGNVSMYAINAATGALTSMGTVSAGGHATSVAVDPFGRFAYVANCLAMSHLDCWSEGPRSGGNVSMYIIDGASGALTSIGTIAAEAFPSSIAIDPSGKFVYVANFRSNSVSMYSIDAATGALTLIGTIGT